MNDESNYYYDVCSDDKKSIYHVWEERGWLNDSITPSVHVSDYQNYITDKIIEITPPGRGVFSLGCGNGFVEAALTQRQVPLSAIDINQDAVDLALRKGVSAHKKCFYDTDEDDYRNVGCIYADGFIGHMFEEEQGLDKFFSHLMGCNIAPGTKLLISNDAPIDKSREFQPHEKVEGFWYVSASFLVETSLKWGINRGVSHYYTYDRPLSGPRRRTVYHCELKGILNARRTNLSSGIGSNKEDSR